MEKYYNYITTLLSKPESWQKTCVFGERGYRYYSKQRIGERYLYISIYPSSTEKVRIQVCDSRGDDIDEFFLYIPWRLKRKIKKAVKLFAKMKKIKPKK